MKKIVNGFTGYFNSDFMSAPFFRMTTKDGRHIHSVAQYRVLIALRRNDFGEKLCAFADANDADFVSTSGVAMEDFECPTNQVEISKVFKYIQESFFGKL